MDDDRELEASGGARLGGRDHHAAGSALAFTRRQMEVVHLLARGYTVDEIGAALEIAPRTARAHVDVLRVKLRVGRQRLLPCAFREATGIDPYSLVLGHDGRVSFDGGAEAEASSASNGQ
jgi:DNA-binding NarL/FixJ family response regulator